MQPITVPHIYQLFYANETPYFKLFMQQGVYGKPSVIANFNPDKAIGEGKTIEEKIEAARKYLDNQLNIFEGNPDLFFQIEMRKNNTASGDAILGPFLFSLIKIQQPTKAIEGLGGFGSQSFDMSNIGSIMNGPIGLVFEAKTKQAQIDFERARLNDDIAQFKEEVKETKIELAKQEEKFNSHAAKLQKAMEGAGWNLFDGIFGVESKSLGKVDSSVKETTKDPREGTPEYDAVGELAEYIYANFKTVEEIQKLHEFIKVNIVKEVKEEEK